MAPLNKAQWDEITRKSAVQPTNDFLNGAKSYTNPNLDQFGKQKWATNQTGTTSTDGNSGSGSSAYGVDQTNTNDFDVEGRINELLDPMNASNEQTYNELMDLAKGDYALVAKWLERAYTQSTGTDDQGRKEFIMKVANDMEAKMGTIAFDYETGTYRTKEDMDISNTQVGDDRTLALKRLSEDDTTLRKGYQTQAVNDREVTSGTLNARGLVNGGYDSETGNSTIQGIGSKPVNSLEQSIQDKFDALTRATERSGTDINTIADRSIANTNLTGNRTLEDLTTTARRDTLNATDTRDFGIDKATQDKLARERELAIQKREADNAAARLAKEQAQREASGYYG